MHHNVNTGNRFTNYTDFGKFWSGTSGNLSYSERPQFCLKVFELFGQLFLLFGTKIGALYLRLKKQKTLISLPIPIHHFPIHLRTLITKTWGERTKFSTDKFLTILMFMKFGRKRKLVVCFEVNKNQLYLAATLCKAKRNILNSNIYIVLISLKYDILNSDVIRLIFEIYWWDFLSNMKILYLLSLDIMKTMLLMYHLEY